MNPDDEGFLSEFELILPKFVSILKAIQDGGEERDIVRLTSDLNAHFKKCNQTLDELPGTDLTHAQQQALLHQYQDQLKRKSALIAKYQNLPVLQQRYTDDAEDNGMHE